VALLRYDLESARSSHRSRPQDIPSQKPSQNPSQNPSQKKPEEAGPMSQPDEVAIPEDCRDLLEANSLGVMTTIRHNDGRISSNPVGYVWDGESVRVSSLKSRMKYKNLVSNPMITFCVVDQADLTRYVEIRGHASFEDDPDRSFLRWQFRRQSGGEEAPADLDPPGAERVTIRIHPEQVSSPVLYGGRFEK
jgi:PPOX class probable F420-dependent enzyme